MSQYFCDFYSNPVPFNPKVLKNISTAERNEILPVISPDNEHIYYTIEYDEYVKGDFAVHHEQLLPIPLEIVLEKIFLRESHWKNHLI